jgi:hypothetical protein
VPRENGLVIFLGVPSDDDNSLGCAQSLAHNQANRG